ncbi:MAG: SH3 domain-containing protein [Thermomicrobiales bacterium]
MDDDFRSPLFTHRMSRRVFLAGAASAMLGAAGPMTAAAATSATTIYRGPTTAARVALTYDCGADAGYTASILDTFARYGVPGSFGMTGQWADRNPGLLRRIVSEGHQLLNHTYDHPSFTGYSTPGTGGQTWEQRRQEIVSAADRIAYLTGVSPRPYFRPPYGDFDDATLQLLGELGYRYNVMWTQDLFGWRGASQQDILNTVAANQGNGYIYLMHVGSESQEGPALPRIIETLAASGYGFATVAGLLGGTGTTPPTPPSSGAFAPGETVKVTAGLYLRTGPGFSTTVITTMPTGTVCTVVSGPQAANGLTWYQVDTSYGRGWAAGEYLARTSGSTPPPPPSSGGFSPGEAVKVTAGLYLRTGPGFSTGVITTMPTGTVCTVVSGPQPANGLTWYQVDTAWGRGWAAGEYLARASGSTTPGGYPAGARLKVTAGLYLRTGPGFSTGVITTMPTGTICTVVSGPQAANGLTWYQVDTAWGRGWAAGEYMTPV